MAQLSYKGIDEAALVHGLYHATRARGMGMLHERAALSIEDVRTILGNHPPMDGKLYFDYFLGRPLKVNLDVEAKTFDDRLFDRDAGEGAAAFVVETLRKGPVQICEHGPYCAACFQARDHANAGAAVAELDQAARADAGKVA